MLRILPELLRYLKKKDRRLIRKQEGLVLVLAKVDKVAFGLQSPAWLKIHLVFRVKSSRHRGPDAGCADSVWSEDQLSSGWCCGRDPGQADCSRPANRSRAKGYLIQQKGRRAEHNICKTSYRSLTAKNRASRRGHRQIEWGRASQVICEWFEQRSSEALHPWSLGLSMHEVDDSTSLV